MITGALAYFAWRAIPCHEAYSGAVNSAIAWVQPVLIFCMLLVRFGRVEIRGFALR